MFKKVGLKLLYAAREAQTVKRKTITKPDPPGRIRSSLTGDKDGANKATKYILAIWRVEEWQR